ncbi:Hexosaminidase D, partial [Trichinella pseudospiralis]
LYIFMLEMKIIRWKSKAIPICMLVFVGCFGLYMIKLKLTDAEDPADYLGSAEDRRLRWHESNERFYYGIERRVAGRPWAPPLTKPPPDQLALLDKISFVPRQLIVHLDLKGAPPRVNQFRDLFEFFKKAGATGLLIEWEDMFPFEGELQPLKNRNAYSKAEVESILRWAREVGLDVIPLVQVLGHLEWMLKHAKMIDLRENAVFPQAICVSNPNATRLVRMIIDQVLALHGNDVEYVHIGADEVYQYGECARCLDNLYNRQLERQDLILEHIANLSTYIRSEFNKRVLVWHDMLNVMEDRSLEKWSLGDLVEPVVWAYAENLEEYLPLELWKRFEKIFKHVWGASAFKGADGPARYYSNVNHYLMNHISWQKQMNTLVKEKVKLDFRGIILTGWQRYDHFAILCELLPVGIPTLAVSLATLRAGDYDTRVDELTARVLGCDSFRVDMTLLSCTFPGFGIYSSVEQLKAVLTDLDESLYSKHEFQGWMNEFSIQNNYSSAQKLVELCPQVRWRVNWFQGFAAPFKTQLNEMFIPNTAAEFFAVYVEPTVAHLHKLANFCKRIFAMSSFPRRPFPIRHHSTTDNTTEMSQEGVDYANVLLLRSQ